MKNEMWARITTHTKKKKKEAVTLTCAKGLKLISIYIYVPSECKAYDL